jgi:hypothetical protein
LELTPAAFSFAKAVFVIASTSSDWRKAAVKFECGLSPFARPIFSGTHPLL